MKKKLITDKETKLVFVYEIKILETKWVNKLEFAKNSHLFLLLNFNLYLYLIPWIQILAKKSDQGSSVHGTVFQI